MRFYPGSAGSFEDDTISEDSQRSPKSSEDVRSLPKTSEVFRSLRTRINMSSLPVLFTSKIRNREECIVIYSFYTWFLFLTWVWVNIFLEMCQARRQQLTFFNQRNWPVSVSRREIEVFNSQVRDSCLRHESWQVYYWTAYTCVDISNMGGFANLLFSQRETFLFLLFCFY